jgi:WD40 repeat protein
MIKIWDINSGECLSALDTGRALYSISFDSSDSYLLTEIGVVDISGLSDSEGVLTNSEIQRPQYRGLALSADDEWITYNAEKLLWLPSEYRPSHSVVSGDVIAIGCGNGRVWMCEVQPSKF